MEDNCDQSISMSDATPTVSTHGTSSAVHEAYPVVPVAESLCEGIDGMTLHGTAIPANLAVMPTEIILEILAILDEKRDWLALARTCRRLCKVVVAELDKYAVTAGEYYALWYACIANKPAILLHHVALDPAVVDHYFTRSFYHEKVGRTFGKDMTPLAVAVIEGRDAIVRLLLAHGADANRPDRCPVFEDLVLWYPINWAVTCKRKNSVSIIQTLKAYSANVNQVPKDLTGGVSECAKGIKCAPIFRVLMLEKPRARSSQISQSTNCETFNNDLLRIQNIRLRQLVALLENGADPNQQYDGDLVTPIFFLLTSLFTYTPSFYFSNSLMVRDEAENQTNLVNEIAIAFLDTLRDFGADISQLGYMYYFGGRFIRRISAAYPETPLHVACRLSDRHKPIIRWFLRNGISVNTLDRAESTPLMAYCNSKFTDLDQFRQFLRCGPLINHQDILGRTALHDLCENRGLQPQVMEKAVRMMLDRGANPTLLDNDGRAPGQGIESTATHITPYEDVLLMLQEACKRWEKWKRKTERKALSELRFKTKDDVRNRREGPEGVCEGRQENQEDGHGNEDKRVKHESGKAVGKRGRSRAKVPGSIRTNRGGYLRGSLSNVDRNTQNHDSNHLTEQKKGQRDFFPEIYNSAPVEGGWGVPQHYFHHQIRGGRYSSGGQTNDRGTGRGGNRDSRSNSGGHQGDINRECRGSHRGGRRGAHRGNQNGRETSLVDVSGWGSTENKPPVERGHSAEGYW